MAVSTQLNKHVACYSRETVNAADAAAAADDDDADDDTGDEDFSCGLYTFLQRVRQCRQRRQQQTEPLTSDSVHIENRLVAAATFEKSYV